VKKVRISKRNQRLNLFLRMKGKVTNKQGEQLLNLVWSRTRIITQKQVPEQSSKQVLVQASKLGPEQLQNMVP